MSSKSMIENGTLVKYIWPDTNDDIIIPDGVTHIGYGAFNTFNQSTRYVSNVVIPSSVQYIDDYAFAFGEYGFKIFSMEIPNTVLEIGDYAFSGKNTISEIILHEGLIKIGSKAFNKQKNLKKLYLPTTLTYIATDAFENCSKQLKFYVANTECYAAKYLEEHNFTLHLINGRKKNSSSKPIDMQTSEILPLKFNSQQVDPIETIQISGKTFVHTGFSKQDELLMESKIKSFGGTCRSSVTGQTDYLIINLQYTKKVTTKYKTAIELRESGKNQKIQIISLEQLEKAFLLNSSSVKTFIDRMNYLTAENTESIDTEFEIRDSVLVKYHGNQRNVIIPDNIVELAPRCFKNRTNIRTVKMPDTVRRIGNNCFFGCSKLRQISLSNNLKEIGEWAFADCNDLEEITIPEGVTSIKSITFGWCYSLSKITLPKSINFIADAAFGEPFCSDFMVFSPIDSYAHNYFKESYVKNVAYGENNILKYDDITIYYELISAYEIKISHVSIENDISEITLPDYIAEVPVTVLGIECFHKSNIKTVILPKTLKKIEQSCFRGSTLETLTLPNTVVSIGESCFDSCKNLTSITLSNGLKEIPNYAFAFCTSLKNVINIENVEKTGIQAFRQCKELNTIC